MKRWLLWLLTVALALGAVPAMGETLRVSGSAGVSLAADYATLQIGVNTRRDSVTEAQQENARLMQAVIDAIGRMGVGEKDVTTSQFSVFSGYDSTYGVSGREVRQYYYQVENMLTVTVRDLSQIGAVLDAAVNAGANTTYGIQFASSKENEAYQQALARAYEDAAAKAEVLSRAAGKTLGALTLIDANQGNYGYGISNVYNAKAAAADTVIISGDVTVSANVVLEYSFQ